MKKINKGNPRVFGVYPAEAIFYEWLDANIHKFKHTPVLQDNGEDYAVYSFENITENITLNVSFDRLESSLYFDNLPGFYKDDDDPYYEVYIIGCIHNEKHHPSLGYYDSDEIDDVLYNESEYAHFSTQKELYIHTVFEAILNYINKMFVSENSLYLIDYGDMTTGFIAPTDSDHDHLAKEAEGIGDSGVYMIRDRRITSRSRGEYVLQKYSLFDVENT